ncbi:MAG: polysaccharide biosynthesis tyrosine autokinase [Gemmatimonadota bacterium]
MSTSVVHAGGSGQLPAEYGQQGWGSPPPSGGSNASRQLILRTLAALKRFAWLIIAVFVVGTVAGVLLTGFVDPKYKVNGSIWVADPAGSRMGPVQAPGLITNDLAWPDLAKSFLVLDPVVSQLALYVGPLDNADGPLIRNLLPSDSLVSGRYRLDLNDTRTRFQLTRLADNDSEIDFVADSGVVGDSIGRQVGFRWQPAPNQFGPRQSFTFDVITPREASGRLNSALVITIQRNSNIMTLELTGENPALIALTMNTLLRQLETEAGRLKKANLVQIANTVEEQLRQAAENLSVAENALEGYKIATVTQPTENVAIAPGISVATNPVLTAYFADRAQHEATRRDREQLERIMSESESRGGKISVEALKSSPAIGASQELMTALTELTSRQANLRTLGEKFTDEYRDVRNERAAIEKLERDVIPAATTRLLTTLGSREREMERRVSNASVELRRIPARTIEEARRQRNMRVANDIYVDLQNRAVAARLAEKTALPDIQIHDTAVSPRVPIADTSSSIIVLAALASLGLGLGLAVLLDRLDSRFRYPEQATKDLGLDVIGAVPSYTQPRSERLRLEQASQLVESFRALALSVRSSFPPGQNVQLTVASPGPGDGKSTVSINLANALAEGGYRTLLIDGDTRRGQLHLSCPPIQQSPGLLDYLAGEATLGEVVRQTELHANLSLIPCGGRRRQGPELLASQRMAQLLRELRSQFDAIIVDSAPLGAGIDAYALGSATGSMLMVLRAGETDRRLAEAKLSTVDRMPIRLLGAVLNDVGETESFRYYRYLEGYGAPAGEETALLAGPASQS